ncbi:hypothetical protein INT43_008019 [Umbelopsis isabellina]|uniref:Uncharacterized protein n=1 Tax=Mortierella isabellina TaxID=91625 RepID=A0A8H7PNL8_MORIS|nr:hypothetical protein INT43_008019 [Umbelopsis isabellina]
MDQDEARRAKVLAAKKKSLMLPAFDLISSKSFKAGKVTTHQRDLRLQNASEVVVQLRANSELTHSFVNYNGDGEAHRPRSMSPDVKPATDLFSGTPVTHLGTFGGEANQQVAKLTERIKELEANERIMESKLYNVNTEYQKAVQELKKLDPVLIASTQKQLEGSQRTVSHLREQLSLAEQKTDSMEYEISGLRQKLVYQEENLSSVRAQLAKSEEQSQEYGDLLRMSNKRADEISEASALYQKSAGNFEKEFVSYKQDLQQALINISERDKIISELRASLEEQTKELVSNGKEISNGKKQLKALIEKSERLSKENRTLIDRVQELQQVSTLTQVEISTEEERPINGVHDTNDTTKISQPSVAEIDRALEITRNELELEKQRTKALDDQLAATQPQYVKDAPLESTKLSLQNLQLQLDVEKTKSREVLGQLASVRSEMADLRRRYMYILEENKQLNELVEAEVFEGDEFGAGMKDFEVNGSVKFNPSTALSPGRYAEYEQERGRIIRRAQANLLNLQDRTIHDPSLRTIESSYSDIDSLRSSSPYDDHRHSPIKPLLPPRIKPRHQAFMDVPKCSGCIGRAVETLQYP